mmetsp:Transcript_22212/g.61854  ORF Transcript_22212/g.61854 Transcript_22212/m.61854 type:complete len:372 (-) Transcript_22212:2626-3741(-)
MPYFCLYLSLSHTHTSNHIPHVILAVVACWSRLSIISIVIIAVCGSSRLVLPQIAFHDGWALHLPFLSIGLRVVQVLIGRHTEDAALSQLIRQRDDVEVEEPDLALVPTDGWIFVLVTIQIGLVALEEEALVPLLVCVPVLHGVRDIRGLDDVLQHDRRTAVHVACVAAIAIAAIATSKSTCGIPGDGRDVLRDAGGRPAVKCNSPTLATQCLQLLVSDVGCHHDVHHELAEVLQLVHGGVDASSQACELWQHQRVPRHVHRVLLSNGLATVGHGGRCLHPYELRIREAGVVHVMDDGREDDGELHQRVRADAVCHVVHLVGDVDGVLIVVDTVWGDDAFHQLASRHGHVAHMLEVVEWNVVVETGETANE